MPPHAPEISRLRRWLGPLYITGVFWFRIHLFGVRAVPTLLFAPFIALFAALFTLALRNVRAALGSNLEAVLGPVTGPWGWWERQLRAYRTIHVFSWCLTERYERLATRRPFTVNAEGLDHWRELNESGRGFLLVTAHLGCWEVGSMLPSCQEARRVHVVREAEIDPAAQKFFAELIRTQSNGLYTTHFAEDPHLGMDLLDALREGEIVALQGDRPRVGGRVEELKLFGRPFPKPIGPAVLARAAGAPLLPVFVFRDGRRRYRCSIRPPVHVPHTADRNADVEQALQSLATELEWAISQRPYQWFCFRKLWE